MQFYTHFIIVAFYLFYVDLWALKQNRGVRKKQLMNKEKKPAQMLQDKKKKKIKNKREIFQKLKKGG